MWDGYNKGSIIQITNKINLIQLTNCDFSQDYSKKNYFLLFHSLVPVFDGLNMPITVYIDRDFF